MMSRDSRCLNCVLRTWLPEAPLGQDSAVRVLVAVWVWLELVVMVRVVVTGLPECYE